MTLHVRVIRASFGCFFDPFCIFRDSLSLPVAYLKKCDGKPLCRMLRERSKARSKRSTPLDVGSFALTSQALVKVASLRLNAWRASHWSMRFTLYGWKGSTV